MELPDPERYFDEHGHPADERTPPWVTSVEDARRWDLCLGIAAQHGGLKSIEDAQLDADAQAFARVLFESDEPTEAPA